MKIKRNKRLKPGDTFKWEMEIFNANSNFNKKTTLVVMAVYPHHILCRDTQEPHNKVGITNAELFQRGIYTREDIPNGLSFR